MDANEKPARSEKRKMSTGFTFHFTTDDSRVVEELAIVQRHDRQKGRHFSVPKRVRCPYCNRRFATQTVLEDHIAINHA